MLAGHTHCGNQQFYFDGTLVAVSSESASKFGRSRRVSVGADSEGTEFE